MGTPLEVGPQDSKRRETYDRICAQMLLTQFGKVVFRQWRCRSALHMLARNCARMHAAQWARARMLHMLASAWQS